MSENRGCARALVILRYQKRMLLNGSDISTTNIEKLLALGLILHSISWNYSRICSVMQHNDETSRCVCIQSPRQRLSKLTTEVRAILGLCASYLAFSKHILLTLQSINNLLSLLGQLRPAIVCDGINEKPRLPVVILLFTLRCLLSLPLFQFSLQLCGFGILFGFYGLGDGGPEPLRFIG